MRTAVVRALIDREVPAREIEIALAVEQGASLTDAAKALDVSTETVKTLYRRLRTRFAGNDREDLLRSMAELGTLALR